VVYRPTKINYLRRKMGTSSPDHLVHLINPGGNGTVTIATVTLASPNFFIDPSRTTCINGGTVPAGGRCQIAVFYKPSVKTGFPGASLVVTDNSSNSPHTTTLQGGFSPR
jgi:hypothetical protein